MQPERVQKGQADTETENDSESSKEIDMFSFISGYIYREILMLPEIRETEVILNLLEKSGIDRKTAIEAIELLKSEGHIFEAKNGYIKALWDRDTFKG